MILIAGCLDCFISTNRCLNTRGRVCFIFLKIQIETYQLLVDFINFFCSKDSHIVIYYMHILYFGTQKTVSLDLNEE